MSTIVKSPFIGKLFLFVTVFAMVWGSVGRLGAVDYTIAPGASEVYTDDIVLDTVDNVISVGADGSGTFSGVISGSGNLVKEGEGLIILSGANTFTGATKLQGGTIRLGNDLALNSWSDAASTQGTVLVTGTGIVATTEDRTISNRFDANADTASLSFQIASGTTLTLQNVTATVSSASYGGAVLSAQFAHNQTFSGGGHLIVQDNTAGNGGGLAGYGQNITTGMDLTGLASVSITGNTAGAGNGGGMNIYSTGAGQSATLLFGNNVLISDNTATTTTANGDGGGLYLFSGNDNAKVQFGNQVTIKDNTAKRFGGGIYAYATGTGVQADVLLGTNTLFEGNKAMGSVSFPLGGGAILSSHNVTVRGDTLFRNNYSGAPGGAIVMYGMSAGTVLLDASEGDIGFSGNLSGVTDFSSPSGTADSIHLLRNTRIQVQGTGNVFFDDPISSGNFAGNSFAMGRAFGSTNPNNSFTGTVRFLGNSTLTNDFAADVAEGTLRLDNGAQFGGATAGTFKLGAAATLAGSGTISFGTNTISGTVAPDSVTMDMNDWNDATNSFTTGTGASPGDAVGTLTFVGNTIFDGATLMVDTNGGSDLILVNTGDVTFGTNTNTIAFSGPASDNTYDIIRVTGGTVADPTGLFQISGLANNRQASVRLNETSDILQVVIDSTAQAQNKVLTWTGLRSGTWNNGDTSDENWTDVPGGTANMTRFHNGDRVIFDTDHTVGPFEVTVAPVGDTVLKVADMTVSGDGDYTITGNITAQTADTTLTDATGKLVKEGTGTLALNGVNDFQGGVEITGGTLKATTADSVGGNVTLSNAATLQFDNTADGTYASNVTGTGNLTKTGSGMLTLQGVNDYVGTTTVGAGTLVGDIASGTDLIVSSGAVYNAGGDNRIVSSLNGTGDVDMTGKSLTVSSGNFTSGDIIDADTIQKTGTGTFSIGQTEAGNLNHTAGTLIIAEDMSVVLTGTASVGDGTTLGIGAGDGTNPSLWAAGSVTIGSDTTINITGYSGVSGVDMLLIHSNVGIIGGDTATTVYTVGGTVVSDVVTEYQFVDGITVRKENADKDLIVRSGGLVWNNVGTSNDAHGYFYVEAGATATISELLADNTHSEALDHFNWDGKTLTKTGDGRLTLNYANTYTGDTYITAGTLIAKNATALGNNNTATANISEGAELVLDFNGTLLNDLTGAGSLWIANSAGTPTNKVLIDKSNAGFSGVTTVDEDSNLVLKDVQAIGGGAVANEGGLTLDFTGTFGNDLSGNGVLDLVDNNTVTISKANTGFAGQTEIQAGSTLMMNHADALGTSAVTVSGTLNLANFGGAALANALRGDGQLNIDDDVELARSNAAFTGDTSIAAGKTATLRKSDSLGNTAGQTVDNDGTLLLAVATDGTFQPNIIGSGNLVAELGDTLTLAGTNTYTGTTTVKTGTLIGNIASGTALTVDQNATYQAGGSDRSVSSLDGAGTVDMQGKNLSIDSGDFSQGTVTDVGTLTKSSNAETLTLGAVSGADLALTGGTLNIAPDKTIALTGSADIAAGTAMGIGANTALTVGGAVRIGSGTTLDVTGYDASQGRVVLIDAGAEIATDFSVYTVDGIDQTQNISLDSYVNATPIIQRNAQDMSQIVIDSGGLVWNNTASGTAHGNFKVNTTATIGDDLKDNTVTGAWSNGWDGKTLTKTGLGTLTLTGENTYSGGTDIQAGNIVATNGGALGTGPVDLAGGTTVEFDVTGDDDTATNDINGTGNLIKDGTGTLTMTGSHTYTGGTDVRGGTLIADLTPADPATLPCGAPLSVQAGAIYQTYSADQAVSILTGSGTVNMNAADGSGNKNLTVCSGDFTDGILANVNDFTKSGTGQLILGVTNPGTSQIVVGGDFLLESGTLKTDLTENPTAKIAVAGTATFKSGSIFSIGRELTLTADALDIETNAVLDVCSCSGAGVLIQTNQEIASGQDFKYTIGGTPVENTITLDIFVSGLQIGKMTDNQGIEITAAGRLVWMNDDLDDSSHGTFNITTNFAVGQDLNDNTVANSWFTDPETGKTWDGKTLTKTGAGTLTLGGTNRYTGGTNLELGTIIAKNDHALGTGGVRLSNGTLLVFDTAQDGSAANIVSGTGSLVKKGSGTLTLTGTNTYTGGTTVEVGTLVANLVPADPGTLPCGTALQVDSGATYRTYSTAQFVSDLTGSGTVNMNAADGSGDKDLTVCQGDFGAGEIIGAGTLTKKSPPTGAPTDLIVGTVSAANLDLQSGTIRIAADKTVTLTGNANIADSTSLYVSAGSNPALVASGTLTIGSDTVLDVDGYELSMGRVVLIDTGATIASDFGKYLIGGVEQTNMISLDHFLDGVLIGRGGEDMTQIVIENGGLVWNNTIAKTAHGTFKVESTYTLNETLSDKPDDGRFFQDPAGTDRWDGKTLTKTGDGTLTLGGTNTYSGGTVVESGTLVAGNESAIGTGTATIEAPGTLVLGYKGTFHNALEGDGKLEITDTMTILRSNADFEGTVLISGKTTTLQEANSLGTAEIELAEGTTLVFFPHSVTQSDNRITGAGQLVKDGGNTLILANTGNDYTGITTVRDGTLVGNIARGTDLVVERGATYRSGGSDRDVDSLFGSGNVDMQDKNLSVGMGDFASGTLRNIATLTKNTDGTLSVGGFDGTTLALEQGTLILTPGATINLTGQAALGDNTVLDIGANLALRAGAVSIGDGATLNISGYGGEGEVVLVTSDSDIQGDFSRYTINGVAVTEQIYSLDHYYYVRGITKEDRVIKIDNAGLAWNSEEPESAHGTFRIDTGTATIDTPLVDKTDVSTFLVDDQGNPLWDGKTLTKTGKGTLVLGAANSFSGGTDLREGTILLAHIDGLGTGKTEIRISGTLQLVADGILDNPISGIGTLITQGDVTVDHVNTDFSGSTIVSEKTTTALDANTFGSSHIEIRENGTLRYKIDGDGTAANTFAGSGRLVKDGGATLTLERFGSFSGDYEVDQGTLKLKTNGDLTLNNTLRGTGTLAVDLGDPDNLFRIGEDVSSAFTGTLALENAGMDLGDADNLALLQHAGLQLNGGGHTAYDRDLSIRNLVLSGGELWITTGPIDTIPVLTVTDLDVQSGTIRMDLTKPIDTTLPGADSFYDYYNDSATAQHLVVSATGTIEGAGTQLQWLDFNGNPLGPTHVRDIDEGTENIGKASFSFLVSTVDTGQKKGLYVGYGLTQLESFAGKTIDLDSTTSQEDSPTINAKLTGQGGFRFAGTKNVLVGNAGSDYTGSTQVQGLTVTLLTDNAFGATSSLDLIDGGKVDMNGKTQTVGALRGEAGTVLTLGTLNVDQTSDGTFGGSIAGSGTLTKQGTGKLVLSGDSSAFTGNTIVSGGTLFVDGSLGGDVKTLGGLLGGRGSIGHNVTIENGAVLSPGDNPGDLERLTVGGTLTFDDGSRYYLEIDGDRSDMLVASSATIRDGADLEIDVLTNVTAGEYEILQTTNGITGLFGELTEHDTYKYSFSQELRDNDRSLWLTWTPTGKDFGHAFGNIDDPNAEEAAHGVDRIEGGGGIDDLGDLGKTLNNLKTDGDVQHAFKQLHGEPFATGREGVARMQRRFARHLPGAADRTTASACSPCDRTDSKRSWNRWGVFTGDWLDRRNIGPYSGYDLRSSGIAFGFDRDLSKRTHLGVAFGYDNADQNFDTIRSKNEFDVFRVAAYGGYRKGSLYLDGHLGYTKDRWETRRTIDIDRFSGTARSKFDDDMLSTGFELGGKLRQGRYRLTPSVGLNYIYLHSPSVTEHGATAANLHVAGDSYQSLRLRFGSRFHWEKRGQYVTWTPELRAYYIAEVCDDSATARTSFDAVRSVVFPARSGAWGRSSGLFGVGVKGRLSDRFSVQIDYDYELFEHTDLGELGLSATVLW